MTDTAQQIPAPPPPPPAPPTPGGTRKRWRLVVAVIAAVAVVAAGAVVVVVATRHSSTLSAAKPKAAVVSSTQHQVTVPEAIMARHADGNGVVDFEGALELFSYAFTPLPGVTIPSGAADDRTRWGGFAASQIARHLGELTPAQLALVLPYFRDASGAATSIAAATTSSRSVPGIVLTDSSTQPGAFVRQDIAALVAKAFQREGALLGHNIGDSPANTSLSQVWLFLPALGVKDYLAWTVSSNGRGFDNNGDPLSTFTQSGKITDCSIFISPSVWGSSSNGHWIDSPLDDDTIYHEVFHCYQGFVLGSITGDVANAAPDWVIEGGATWAAGSILPYDEEWWDKYLTTPTTPLSQRSYDGFGFLFEIEHEGRPLWPVWWNTWVDASHGGWDTKHWFDELVATDYTKVINAWAASFYLDNVLGFDWTTSGTGQKPTPAFVPGVFHGELSISTTPLSTYQEYIGPPADPSTTLIVASATDPTMRLEDEQHDEQTGVDVSVLCWARSCHPTCPKSDAPSPPNVFHVSGVVSWAFTAVQQWGMVNVQTINLQAYCKLKPRQTPAPPCPASCSGSNGDPHMTTVNGRKFEFQTAGEYELLRSADGSVEVQARQEQYLKSGLTINTAVAVRMGTHRVGVYLPSGGGMSLEVHVDGRVTALSSAMSVGGGKLVPYKGAVAIQLADGTVVWALYKTPRHGINIQIQPSAAMRTKSVGVLGPVALGYVLPMLPDGTGRRISVDKVAEYEYTYTKFAPAWRVTDATTLFDYAPGKNTASYNVPGFVPLGGPPRPTLYGSATPFDPQARASAETSCAALDDVDLRNQCVYDVAATGDVGFVDSYTSTAQFLVTTVNGSAPSGGPSPSNGPTIAPLLSNAGAHGYVIGPDGALDIVVTTQSGSEIIAVDPTTTTIRTQMPLAFAPGSGLAVASGSLWLIEATANPNACTVNQIDPTTLKVTGQVTPPSCPLVITPDLAGAGDQLWTVGENKQLERIDTTTRTVVQTIPVQDTVSGGLHASASSVFWSDETGVYRIDSQTSSLVKINDPVSGVFFDDGMWVQIDAGTVGFINSYGATPRTLDAGRDLMGADEKNVYMEDPSTNAMLQYPEDGSQGNGLGTSGELGGVGQYLVIGDHNAFRVYSARPPQGEQLSLYVENYPLP
jgi:hypothetical protein